MGNGGKTRVLVRGALVAWLLIGGVPSAASTSLSSPPVVTKVHARPLKTVGTKASWLLTATAVDRDRDLVGGRVTIRIGAKGKAVSRRIVAVKSGLSGAGRNAAPVGAGITSATLAGSKLRVVFFVNARPGPISVRFSVSDAHGRTSKQVALNLKVSAAQTVTIAATRSAAAEPSVPGVFTVTRSGTTAAALSVSYTVTGTATPGRDYTELPASVTIPAGASSAPITVVPIDDETAEPSESVILTLADKAGYTVGSPSKATVTIADDDGGTGALSTVTIVATDPSAGEPLNTGTFLVARIGSVSSALVVSYTVSGTATPSSDYVALTGSVTIQAGTSSAFITVTPIDDVLAESAETVTVTLSSSTRYTVGTPSSATVTIADNDSPTSVTIAATDPVAAEPADTGTFTVTRTGSTTTSLFVAYTVSGSATGGSDYASLPGTVMIPAGSFSATITVTPIDDLLAETAETVVVILTPAFGYTVGTPGTATVTITDNDSGAVVTIAATDPSAAEPADTGTFTVTRTGATTAPLTVSYAVTGAATNGTDYTTLSGSVTIAAGASSASITVTPIDDTTVEGAETVVLTLTADTGYNVGSPSNAVVTIADDDAPTVTITATDPNAAEPSDPGTFTVTRTGSTTAPLTVNYTISGTATNGTDYTTLSGSVTIPAGSSSATITVSPIDDALLEGAETVILTLSADPGYSVGTPSSATVTIADDEH